MSVLSDIEFRKFKDLIYKESGIHFTESNRTILESRIREKLRKSSFKDVNEFLELIVKDEGELKQFLDSITTNLTRFFRNNAHYSAFQKFVIPDLIEYKRKTGNKVVRCWSAGCSTGEEPYTNAMVLKECLPSDFKIEVVASDLSLKSLMTAQEGFYSDMKVKGIPEEYLAKYFSKATGGYRVKDEIKKMIAFDYHNLKFDSGKRNLDIVFCRNVLIYFDEPAQKNVIDRFWDAMSNHSYLFIGHSESLFGMDTKFEFLRTEWACLYGKNL